MHPQVPGSQTPRYLSPVGPQLRSPLYLPVCPVASRCAGGKESKTWWGNVASQSVAVLCLVYNIVDAPS
ncbi:hypothetical protein J6590_099828 [Homalodisca vitripennis]|nr:hypothetical protein J6590_099828 [Homalodisca vitripennis]